MPRKRRSLRDRIDQVVAVNEAGIDLTRRLNLYDDHLVCLVECPGERLQEAVQSGVERRLEDRDQSAFGVQSPRRLDSQLHRPWMVSVVVNKGNRAIRDDLEAPAQAAER